MDKLIDFLYKEYFITESIKFSIVTILFVTMIFLVTYFSLKIIKKIATKKLDEERKLKFMLSGKHSHRHLKQSSQSLVSGQPDIIPQSLRTCCPRRFHPNP